MPEISTETVSFAANGADAPGYLALPGDGGPHPGVVVIQEVWGVDEHIKDVTRRFANEGFVAVAPDLYRGKIAIDIEEARKIRMEMQFDQAMLDLQGALDFLKGRDDVTPKKLGVIGFCMGGSLTQQIALRSADVGAAAAYYGGRGAPSPEEMAAIPLRTARALWRGGSGHPAGDRRCAAQRARRRGPAPRDRGLPGRAARLL